MFYKRRTLIPLLGLFMGLSCCNTTFAPFSETPDSGLSDLAMIRADPHWGTVVIYNPNYCEQIGDACRFFRAHAFAHAMLNHVLLASPAHYPDIQEAEADCYAARRGNPKEVLAAVNFLRQVDVTSLQWKIYGDPRERAEAIRKCAIKGGRWIGEE